VHPEAFPRGVNLRKHLAVGLVQFGRLEQHDTMIP
jgi:hypothetical protein